MKSHSSQSDGDATVEIPVAESAIAPSEMPVLIKTPGGNDRKYKTMSARVKTANLVDLDQIKYILKYIDDKDEFVLDLLECINNAHQSRQAGSLISKCVNEWLATAEICASPKIRRRVREAHNILTRAGIIHGR